MINKLNCLAPYGHYHLDVHGYAKPCCWWMIDPNRKLSEFSCLEEIGKFHANMMLDDNLLDTSCAKCILYEQKDTNSLRNIIHRNVTEQDELHRPVELEISLDSVCNFACIICDSARSSKWRSLQKKVDWTPKQNSEDPSHFETVMRLLKNSDLSQLKEIKMLGGEPFYTKKFHEFVNLISEKCDISKITLMITSNMSVFPNDELYKTLFRFKKIKLMASLDAIGTTAEVVRFGTKWKQVDKNITRWIKEVNKRNGEGISLAFGPTFSLYNLEHVNTLKNWYVRKTRFKFYMVFTLAREPYLTIENLDKEFRSQFDKHLFPHPRWSMGEDFFSKWPKKENVDYDLIYRYIDTYSTMTGTDIASTIPKTMEQLEKQRRNIS